MAGAPDKLERMKLMLLGSVPNEERIYVVEMLEVFLVQGHGPKPALDKALEVAFSQGLQDIKDDDAEVIRIEALIDDAFDAVLEANEEKLASMLRHINSNLADERGFTLFMMAAQTSKVLKGFHKTHGFMAMHSTPRTTKEAKRKDYVEKRWEAKRPGCNDLQALWLPISSPSFVVRGVETSVIVTGTLNKVATVILTRVLPKGFATQILGQQTGSMLGIS
eukprot:s696_g17.t1